METWRDIPGYEGLYRVSDHGQVWNVRMNRPHTTWRRKKHRLRGRLILDYVAINLVKDGKRKTRFVHVLMLEAFVGPKPTPRHVTMHLNDIPYDNRLENLKWGTESENNKASYGKRKHVYTAVHLEKCGKQARKVLAKPTTFKNIVTGEVKLYESSRMGLKDLGFHTAIHSRHMNTGKPYRGYIMSNELR